MVWFYSLDFTSRNQYTRYITDETTMSVFYSEYVKTMVGVDLICLNLMTMGRHIMRFTETKQETIKIAHYIDNF